MKNRMPFYLMAAISAAVVILVGGLVLGLAGLYFFTPTAEAQTKAGQVAGLQAQATDLARTITVVGQGKVKGKPDIAQANVGVEIIGPDVKETSAKASDTMDAILTALRDQGVADEDIQTSFFNVWVERPFNPQSGSSDGEVIYHVNNNVTVTIRNLDNVTTILGAAIEAGANNVNSVNFNLSDPEQLGSEARGLAVENARAKAEELATLNGVEIGDVVSVSEVIGGGVNPINSQYAAAGIGGGGGPLLPGDVEVSIQLQVTYAIQ